MIVMAQGDKAAALGWLIASLETQPDNPEALGWAATLSLNLKNPEKAETFARRLTTVDTNNARAHYLLACALRDLDRIEEAISAIDSSLAIEPDDPDRLVLKARLLSSWRLPALAVEFYKRAMEIRPTPAAAIDLAQILLRESHPEEALEMLLKVSPLMQERVRPFDLIARAYTELQQFEAADSHWSLAEQFSPDRPAVLRSRAKAEIAAGRFEVAEALLTEGMEDDLEAPAGFLLLATVRKMKLDDLPLIERMQSLLAKGGLSRKQAVDLNFGLGKSFDDLGEYETAIGFFDEANRVGYELDPKLANFGRDDARAFTDFQIAYFTRERIHELERDGLSTDLPIFIVGMARSGTTLTESILSAHSRVQSRGEQSFWPERAIEFFRWSSGPVDLNHDLAIRFAHEYLEFLTPGHAYPGATECRHVIDKNPNNFLYAALLHGLFPNAKIVHMQRHAVANVLSIWMTPEVAKFLGTRENLVFAYREHLRLLNHLREVLPENRFATFRYEDLTSEPKATISAMLDFVELEPEDACFEPEKNSRAVLTPSAYQVRQPIDRRSQEKWRHYERWLGPFTELLDAEGRTGDTQCGTRSLVP